MSEQMTVTEPRVSTAGSRRTMAWRRAMRCTPSASVTVMMAGRPSGMAEAASATTIKNISAGACSRHSTPSTKVAAASARMVSARMRPKRSIWRSSGVLMLRIPASMRLIWPSSVRLPVATTMPVACP
ncbi:hypothetical protein D9M68_713530 [compost metagenome]